MITFFHVSIKSGQEKFNISSTQDFVPLRELGNL